MMDFENESQDSAPEMLSRRRRTRTIFTNDAIGLMEREFNRNRYPDIHKRESMAAEIGVSEARVQVWFQNRRARVNKRKSSSSKTQHYQQQEKSRENLTESRDNHEPPRKQRKLSKKEDPGSRSNQSSPSPDSGYQSSGSSSCGPTTLGQMSYGLHQLPSVYSHPYFRLPYLNVPLAYAKLQQQQQQTNDKCDRMPQFPVPAFDAWFPYPGMAYPGMNLFEPYSDRTKKGGQDNTTDDNVVNRLFRFSDKYKTAWTEERKSPQPYQIVFPRRRTSSCTIDDFRCSEERNVESPLSRSPVNSDKEERDMSESGQESSGNGGDDSGFANDSSSESSA